MKKIAKNVFLCAFIAYSANGLACEEKLHASSQVKLNVKADVVWNLLKDFNGLNKWHPAVVKSALFTQQGTDVKKGDLRKLTLGDGGIIYDSLVGYDPSSMAYTYELIGSPLPIEEYLGIIKVIDDGASSSTVIWSSSFCANGTTNEKAITLIGGIYDAGLNALPDYFIKHRYMNH